MQYIVHRRFRGKVLCGEVNIPALTVCDSVNNVIYYNGNPICFNTSEDAHQFFAWNDDENGLQRGHLTQAIQKSLQRRDAQYQTRWNKVWADPLCQKYKRPDHEDFWLWNHDFFNAPIEDLQHIARLLGVK